MNSADKRALTITKAESEIRRTVKEGYLRRQTEAEIRRAAEKIVREVAKGFTGEMQTTVANSLLRFYKTQSAEFRRSFLSRLPVISCLFLLSGERGTLTAAEKEKAMDTLERHGFDRSRMMGVPFGVWSKEYTKKYVRPALDRLVSQYALDPDDAAGRNSLRARAEMEVRYEENRSQISSMKRNGVRLVICSAHADCSERCRPFQGKVFSLDGTSGMTDDGRSYQPIEIATDVYYTTRAGKTYKNGLLGFNCRHRLIPYRNGYRVPHPNAERERMEYALTQEQRRLERNVRKYRIRALESKGLDAAAYREAKRKEKEWNRRYIDFCLKNGKAIEPMRTTII